MKNMTELECRVGGKVQNAVSPDDTYSISKDLEVGKMEWPASKPIPNMIDVEGALVVAMPRATHLESASKGGCWDIQDAGDPIDVGEFTHVTKDSKFRTVL